MTLFLKCRIISRLSGPCVFRGTLNTCLQRDVVHLHFSFQLDVSSPGHGGGIPLVRVRNPWGNEAEWKGAWSDNSREWSMISNDIRMQLGLTIDDDGEFW